jgi:hypothetical protein
MQYPRHLPHGLRFIPLTAVVLALALAAGPPPIIAAYDTWCFDDPVIVVDGQLIDIRVGMPPANVATVRRTTLTVVIPRNVPGAVVVDDISAFPMTTTVSPTGPIWNGRGPLPLSVRTDVTAASAYPIAVTATPLLGLGVPLVGVFSPLTGTTSGTGTANTPLVLELALAR